MKFGIHSQIKAKVDPIVIKRKKPSAKQKRDIANLQAMFSNLSLEQIESVYNDQKWDLESSVDILSTIPNTQDQHMDLLENMFVEQDKAMIHEVYESCQQNIEKATAFLIEANSEMIEDEVEENEFGNSSIGYVNDQALKRRIEADGLEMIFDIFPNMSREFIIKTFQANNGNIYETVRIINETFPNHHIPEEKKTQPQPKSTPTQAFPSLCSVPRSKVPTGVWSRYSNNHFLDGNNLDAVNKLNSVFNCFPAGDKVLIKEIFFHYGDDYNETVRALQSIYPGCYREPPLDPGPIRISHSSPVKNRIIEDEPRIIFGERMRDDEYREKLEIVNRCRKLQEAYYQGASRAAAVGNWNEAKRLSTEGKRYQADFEKAYGDTYMETFRKNNQRDDAIDLHGLRVKEALELLGRFLNQSRQDGIKRVEVITGKGVHSHRCIAKIKPAVAEFLASRGLKASELEGGYSVLLS